MSVVFVPLAQWYRFKQDIQRHHPDHSRQTFGLMRGIMGASGLEFSSTQKDILMFILAVTYGSGRRAASIMRYQFDAGFKRAGSDTLIVGPLKMSERTLRSNMQELCDRGFIIRYAAKASSGYENEARVYAIDCKKIAVPDVVGSEKGGGNLAGRGVAEEHPHHRDINRIAKAIHPAVGGARLVGEFNEEEESVMLKEPKKGRWQAPAQSETAATVVQRIQSTAVARVTRRVESAQAKAPHLLTVQEMQAVIDKHMATYAPGAQRVMVTQREHGAWRKELKANPPGHGGFDDFVGWMIGRWREIASQHRKALVRRESQGQRTRATPMPSAPTFSSMVYRYRYFLAAYGSFKTDRITVERDEATDREVKALKAQLARAESDKQVLRKALTTRTVRPSAERPSLRVVTPKPVPAATDDSMDWLGSDEPIAPWVDSETDEYAKRA